MGAVRGLENRRDTEDAKILKNAVNSRRIADLLEWVMIWCEIVEKGGICGFR